MSLSWNSIKQMFLVMTMTYMMKMNTRKIQVLIMMSRFRRRHRRPTQQVQHFVPQNRRI